MKGFYPQNINPSARSSIQFIKRWPNSITLWISETKASTSKDYCTYETGWFCLIDLPQRARVRLANVEA